MSNPSTPNLGSSPQSDANQSTQRRNSPVQSNLDPPARSNPIVNDVNTQSPQRQGFLRGAADLEESAIREQEKIARIEKLQRILDDFKEDIARRISNLNEYVQDQKEALRDLQELGISQLDNSPEVIKGAIGRAKITINELKQQVRSEEEKFVRGNSIEVH
jgi:hypothetical protein